MHFHSPKSISLMSSGKWWPFCFGLSVLKQSNHPLTCSLINLFNFDFCCKLMVNISNFPYYNKTIHNSNLSYFSRACTIITSHKSNLAINTSRSRQCDEIVTTTIIYSGTIMGYKYMTILWWFEIFKRYSYQILLTCLFCVNNKRKFPKWDGNLWLRDDKHRILETQFLRHQNTLPPFL